MDIGEGAKMSKNSHQEERKNKVWMLGDLSMAALAPKLSEVGPIKVVLCIQSQVLAGIPVIRDLNELLQPQFHIPVFLKVWADPQGVCSHSHPSLLLPAGRLSLHPASC